MARRSRGQRRRHAVQQRKQSERRRAEADDTQPPPKLMTLPAELRNRIWGYVFEGSIQELHGSGHAISGMKGKWKYCTRAPQLLLTCKQVYTEAIGIYYSMTTFFSKVVPCEISGEKLEDWMRSIGIKRAKLIKNLRFFHSRSYDSLNDIADQSPERQENIDEMVEFLEIIDDAVARVHDGRPCVHGNLWFEDNSGKGFEVWTSDPQETDQEIREAHKQGTAALEEWLAGKASAVSRWQVGYVPSFDYESDVDRWDEDRLNAFDKWYWEKYSAVAKYRCGCGRACRC